MDPLLTTLVTRIAHDEPHSALPNAPVVAAAEPSAYSRASVRVRATAGAALHALARRVEPTRTEERRLRTA